MNPPYTGKYPNKTGKTFKKEMWPKETQRKRLNKEHQWSMKQFQGIKNVGNQSSLKLEE
jgi:hypothetical protein